MVASIGGSSFVYPVTDLNHVVKNRIARHLPDPVLNTWHNFIRPVLPDWSFITIHYAYYFVVCLVTSLIFWASSKPAKAVSYLDSLFLVVAAMTEAGLNTVNLSQLTTFQQATLFILMMLGSAIWVSIATVHVRKRAFEDKLQELADHRERRRKLSKTFQSVREKTSQIALPTTFQLSRSKIRRNSKEDKEASGSSSAVPGSPVVMGDATSKYPKSPSTPQPHITFTVPDMREGADEHALPDGSTGPENSPQKSQLSLLSPKSDVHSTMHAGDDRRKASVVTTQTATQERQSLRSPYLTSGGSSFITTPGFRRTQTKIFSGRGVGARHNLDNHPRNAMPQVCQPTPRDDEEKGFGGNGKSLVVFDKYLKGFNGFVGRNSQFHGLTEKERRKLGGLEYDALVLLSYLVPTYFFLFQFIGAIAVGAWIHVNRPDMARENGQNPFWTGSFFAVSAFNNNGMGLLDANAAALQTSYFCLLTLAFLMLAGNTCFPPFLRLIIWTIKICIPGSSNSPEWDKRRQILQFVLDHPRRVYTHLFPGPQTWWLVGTLIVLNGIDWVAFEVLNIGNPLVESTPVRFRILMGFFQAIAVRKGGFLVTTISRLRPAVLCLYIYMMYLSDLPVTLTIRNTNIYEERSLGIYAQEIATAQPGGAGPPDPHALRRYPTIARVTSDLKRRLTGKADDSNNPPADTTTTTFSRYDFLSQQVRGQLSHDLWWLAGAILLIVLIETSQFNRDPVVFSIFNTIFECVSAYATVGLTVGVPWNAYSFCGAWHKGSKLVLCAVMLRGRHRGLPVAIDRAVLVPDETLGWAEEEDAAKRARNASVNPQDWES